MNQIDLNVAPLMFNKDIHILIPLFLENIILIRYQISCF